MNDTTPEAAAQFERILRERSGGERVRMMSDMFDTARALVIASIKAQRPAIGDADLRVQVFRRLYASDFTPEDLVSITDRLRPEPAGADMRAASRQWLDNWKRVGPILEQERWDRVRALTDADAARDALWLFELWQPDWPTDDGEELLVHQRVFAKARRT